MANANSLHATSPTLRTHVSDLRRRATRSRSSDGSPTAAPTPPFQTLAMPAPVLPVSSGMSSFSGGTLFDAIPASPSPHAHDELSDFHARLSRIQSAVESQGHDSLYSQTFAPVPSSSLPSSYHSDVSSDQYTYLDFDEFSYRGLAWKDCHYCDFELFHDEPPISGQLAHHICLGYCEHARKREGRTLQGHRDVILIRYWWYAIKRVWLHPHRFVKDVEGVREDVYGKRGRIRGSQKRWLVYVAWMMFVPLVLFCSFVGMIIGLPWYVVEDRPWTDHR